MRFIPPDYYFVEDSAPGMDGAFRAVNGGDAGSPGYVTNPAPRFLSVTLRQTEVVLKCRVVEGKQYALQTKLDLAEPYWMTVGTYSADNSVITISQPPNDVGQRFFLLKEMP